jgi:hypothetical protein
LEVFIIEKQCCICSVGHIGFCRCDDNARLALMCVNCESLWDEPEALDAVRAHFPPHAAATGDATRWATQAEIELRGWLDHIFGELFTVKA